MKLTPILLLAALCGLVAAGFVWFAWGMIENLLSGDKKKYVSPDEEP